MCRSSKDAFKGVCGGGRIHTLHKLQRALTIQPWSWAALEHCTVFSPPGDNGSERGGEKDEWGIRWPERDERTMPSIMANTWMRTRAEEGRRGRTAILYAIFSSWLLLWKTCHICQRRSPDSSGCTPAHAVFMGAAFGMIQRASLSIWFLFWRSWNSSGYCHCQNFALI